jgi:short-subunit dehydrogenase
MKIDLTQPEDNMNSKVIVVTGASSGIGAALAGQLGAEGNKLVLAARREHELKQVAEQSGDQALPVICDVTKRADIENLREAALAKFGHIDIWINNAGRGISRKVMELAEDEFDQIVAVNLKSAFYGMQAIVPYFQKQTKGHLINVSSFLGKVPMATFRSIYSASKAALNLLTANLRMDLGRDYPDIHVSLIMPGPVATDFVKNSLGATGEIPPRTSSLKMQSADEVAAIILDTIKNPRPEIFTQPALAEITANYYRDVAAFEKNLRQNMPRP